MLFDLEDLEMWEPVLFGATSKKQLIDAVAKRKEGQEAEETIFKQEVSLVTLLSSVSHRIRLYLR